MKRFTVFNVMFLAGLVCTASLSLPVARVAAQEKAEEVPLDPDGTVWEVTTMFINKKNVKEEGADTLTFKNSQFIAQSFEQNKYAPTNYSLNLEDNGTTTFGTMQIKGTETSFWKGVIEKENISGSVHTQFSPDNNKTIYFQGKLTSGVVLKKGEKKPDPAVVPQPETPVAQQAVQAEAPIVTLEPAKKVDPVVQTQINDQKSADSQAATINPEQAVVKPQVIEKQIDKALQKVEEKSDNVIEDVKPRKKKRGWFNRSTE